MQVDIFDDDAIQSSSSSSSSSFKKKTIFAFILILGLLFVIGLVSFFGGYYLYLEEENNNTSSDNDNNGGNSGSTQNMQELCDSERPSFKIVESIPFGDFNSTLSSPFESTTASWITLFSEANSTIDIACYYFTLNDTQSNMNETGWGEWGKDIGIQVMNELIAAAERGVQIRIVQSAPFSPDSLYLQQLGYAEVKEVNLTQLAGSGIIHTKFILVDDSSFYIGSANMDWRALTQVKELGVVVSGSQCLGDDLKQTFELYWELGSITQLPTITYTALITTQISCSNDACQPRTNQTTIEETIVSWPSSYNAYFNISQPALIHFLPQQNRSEVNETSAVYMTSAPKYLCPDYRTNDLDAVLHIINSANESVSISLMDYVPASLYQNDNYYWDVVDSAMRDAAFRNVNVRLLVSIWNQTRPSILQYTSSLDQLDHLEVRYFIVPDIPGVSIPYTRVNHAKYLISEQYVSVTTSNWSADYFEDTAGVSFVCDDQQMIDDVQYVFDRDWNSEYAHPANCTSSSYF